MPKITKDEACMYLQSIRYKNFPDLVLNDYDYEEFYNRLVDANASTESEIGEVFVRYMRDKLRYIYNTDFIDQFVKLLYTDDRYMSYHIQSNDLRYTMTVCIDTLMHTYSVIYDASNIPENRWVYAHNVFVFLITDPEHVREIYRHRDRIFHESGNKDQLCYMQQRGCIIGGKPGMFETLDLVDEELSRALDEDVRFPYGSSYKKLKRIFTLGCNYEYIRMKKNVKTANIKVYECLPDDVSSYHELMKKAENHEIDIVITRITWKSISEPFGDLDKEYHIQEKLKDLGIPVYICIIMSDPVAPRVDTSVDLCYYS
jgi:hypothetical protein